jgi:DbpA RNA binding domain
LFDDHALVDVQRDLASNVAHALRAAKIKGRKLPVREER